MLSSCLSQQYLVFLKTHDKHHRLTCSLDQIKRLPRKCAFSITWRVEFRSSVTLIVSACQLIYASTGHLMQDLHCVENKAM